MERTIATEVGVAQVYFNYKQVATMQQTADQVLASILRQLVQHKALPPELGTAYDKWMDQGQRNRPDGQFFAGLIAQCSKDLKARFIVLDAFDECADEERNTIVTYLQQFVNCGFKVYVTTRMHLRDFLAESFGTVASLIQIKADGADVERFVRESLRELLISDPLKEDILRVIQDANASEYALYRPI